MVKFYQTRFFLVFLLFIVFNCTQVLGQQLPQINYQGVARKADGSPIMEQSIALRLTIRDGGATGSSVYSETRQRTTNKFGLFTVVIGSTGALSQSGSMAAVNWSTGNKFLQVEIDPAGGGSFIDMGTSQLQSVPYAIYAGSATPGGAAGGDLGGTYPNPTVTKLQGSALSTTAPNTGQILKWNGTVWLPSDVAATIDKADATTDGYLRKEDWLIFNGKATVTYVDAAILTNANALADETTRATTAEGVLTTNVASKEALANKSTDITADAASDIKYPSVKSVKTYLDAVSAVSSIALSAEVARATAAEGVLTTAIATNATAISTEASRAAAAEGVLTTATTTNAAAIATNGTAISTEASRATAAEGVLTTATAMNAAAIATNGTAISTEASRAAAAEGVLTTATATNAAAIATNATAISTEASRAAAAEGVLTTATATNAAAIATNATAISTEASRAAAAEGVLTTATATNAAAIATNATAISTEASRAAAAEATLASDLATESSSRTTELALKAPLASPDFTGTPTAPTAPGGTATTQIATTAFVSTAVSTAATLDATEVVKGKIQLAGDLAGTAALPIIADGKITSAKILDGTITNTDISATAGIVGTQLAADADITSGQITSLAASKITGIITGENGGTGVVNTDKTITLGGNLTTTGAFATTLTSTAATNVTLPVSGTLATLAGTETLIGKTLIAPIISTISNEGSILSLPTVAGTLALTTSDISGKAATVTTNANLTGEVTSIGNATTLTNSAVLAKVLTGYSSGAGTVSATDNILTAIQKLNGNITSSSVGSVDLTTAQTITGIKTFSADISVNGITVGRGSGAIEAINNTAVGHETLKSNTAGFFNTAIGSKALATNTEGARNTAVGADALATNNGNDNTSTGYIALSNNTTGNYNAGFGSEALRFNTSGSENTAVGGYSLTANTLGAGNTAVGHSSLRQNTTGEGNTAIGTNSLSALVTGTYNTALGTQSLQNSNGASSSNTAIGAAAIDGNTTGNGNAVLGAFAGRYISDGSTSNTKIDNSVLIGAETKPNASGETNQIVIGYGATGMGSNTVQLGNGSITLVNTSGAITSAGTITGASIVKVGGQNSQILMADGSVLTAGTNVTINDGTISASSGSSITELADEFTATASQVSFTLTHVPSANSKVKMYINGIRISNTAYSISGETLTYNALNNGSYNLSESDRIQFDYFY